MRYALAPTTFATYSSAWNSFDRFCTLFGFPPYPLSAVTLEYYIASVAHRLAYRSIKVYLSALHYRNAVFGFPPPWLGRVHYLLRGIRRFQGNSRIRPRRLPITLPMLHVLFRYLHSHCCTHDALCFRAASAMAFFGMLRVSEYTSPSSSFYHPLLHLSTSDVVPDFALRFLLDRIKASKTDPFRSSAIIRLPVVDSFCCPYTNCLHYLLLRRRLPPGPFFVLSDGSFLTRAHVQSMLAAAFPRLAPGLVSSHSFRAGGASAAASIGVPDSANQILGRWSSQAFRAYLHLSDDYLSDVHRRISSTTSLHRLWDVDRLSSVAASSLPPAP